ncbi:MAG: peptide chain release factor N(5)-glutamine methyltransferase [Rhodospirillales bacterium]
MSAAERSQPVWPAVSLAGARAETRRALAAAGIATAALEARLFVEHAAGVSPATLLTRGDQPLHAQAGERLATLVARRSAHEPVAYILGEKEFWSLPFAVDPSTLIPRPDSETLVEAALAFVGEVSGNAARRRGCRWRILDFGTGSGCLLLALLHSLPAATGVGIDLSPTAVRTARANAERLRLASRAAFLCGNWADALAGSFDIIVANPPYIADGDWPGLPPDVRGWEPRLALSGGSDGLAAYRELLPATARLLDPGGAAFFELGAGQAADIASLAAGADLQPTELVKDLAGIGRCLQLTAHSGTVVKKTLGNQALPV